MTKDLHHQLEQIDIINDIWTEQDGAISILFLILGSGEIEISGTWAIHGLFY
jgi:hypothetical protein